MILSFASLLFATRGWMPLWLPFTSYAVALIAARLILGHLPDRIGGAKVALICVFVEVAGLALLGLASSPLPAAFGAALLVLAMLSSFPDWASRRFVVRRRNVAGLQWAPILPVSISPWGFPGLCLVSSHMESVSGPHFWSAASLCSAQPPSHGASNVLVGVDQPGTLND